MTESNYIVKKEDMFKVRELFYKMQKDYPEIFGDLYLSQGFCCGIWIEGKRVSMSMEELIDFQELPIDAYTNRIEYDTLQKINKDLSYAEFVLLHELGHWLDYLDNPEEFNYNLELKKEEMDFLEDCHATNDFMDYFYYTTKLEKKATRNAFRMAKVLADKERE